MAGEGAWQTSVYGNGGDFNDSKQRYPQQGPPPGEVHYYGSRVATPAPIPGAIPPAIYNPPATTGGKGPAITSITLRVLTIVFTFVATAITVSLTERAWSPPSTEVILAVNVIVCFYSIVQLVVLLVRPCTGRPVLPGPTSAASTIIFIFDQIMTYLLMSVCGIGAYYLHINRSYLCASKYTTRYRSLCDRWIVCVLAIFAGFACMAITTGIQYVYRVYKMATKPA